MENVTAYFVEKTFIPKGEYKLTELDKHKAQVDFLIIGIGNRYEISFNKPTQLKCNRSITKANNNGSVYFVTEKALDNLKKNYSWACDF